VWPWADLVRRAGGGEDATAVDRVGESDLIRAAVPIQDDGKTVGVVVVDSYVPVSVAVRRDESERAFNEYLRLKIQRRPIQTNYTITLAVVTIVVLFSATWFGFYLARGITVPIQRLAEGTRAVAHGDLDHRIEGEGEAGVRELAAELRATLPAAPGLGVAYAPGGATAPVERQLKLARDGREVAVLLTGTRLLSENVGPRGLVLFFEDVSHLLRVQ